jgi:hypothetical protein
MTDDLIVVSVILGVGLVSGVVCFLAARWDRRRWQKRWDERNREDLRQ